MTAHDQLRDDLPLYAVGALPAGEASELERHLATCASCLEELRDLQQASAQIALAVDAVAPSRGLQQRLLARIEAEGSPLSQRTAPAPPPEPARSSRRGSPLFWLPAFAAVVLAIISGMLWSRTRTLGRENLDLAEKLVSSGESLRQTLAVVDLLQSVDAQRVTLVEAGQTPKPEAKTIYSPQRRSLILLASHLHPLPANKTYELWLLPVNGGAPLPEGTFIPDANGSASLVLTQLSSIPAKGFAVTAEMKPGSATPTLPILLSGTS